MRKTILGGAVLAALVIPLAMSPAAIAADGDQFVVNGDFSSVGVNGLLDTPNTTTDFALGDGTLGYGPDNGSMYDPGRYIIGTNPLAVHSAWIDLSGSADPMLILNGFTEGSQKVWEQRIETTPCTTPGSSIEFAFSANAMNILRDDWVAANAPGQVGGANISVTINGQPVGDTIDLLTNDPGNIVGTSGTIAAPEDGVLDVVIWNNGVAYLGNDFAIDDITLTQVGDCQPPCTEYVVAVFDMPGWDATVGKTFPQNLVSVSEPTCNPEFPPPPDCKNTQMDIFRADGPLWAAALADEVLTEAEGNDPALWAEMFEGGSANSWRLYQAANCPLDATANVVVTPPTCDAPSSVSLSGLLFASLVGTLDLTVGTHTATFTAETGHFFANGTNTLTVEYTIDPKDTTSDVCIPDIGGKTIGWYKTHAVTNVNWNIVRTSYPALFPTYTTSWTGTNGGLSILNASSSTNLGKDMLRAQFLATALNTLTIAGYGDQYITVPVGTAVDGGTTVRVNLFLSHVNDWIAAGAHTKAEYTSVQSVLNAINQDIASTLFV